MKGISEFRSKINSYIIRRTINRYECVQQDDDNQVKYLFIPSKKESKTLIVGFSGFAGHHVKGKYNYIRTLMNVNANKLFLLDDMGFENVGSYYLGEHCKIWRAQMIPQIVAKVKTQINARKVICIGSSKGASAALIYGNICGANDIIIGSPQYHIADYLSSNDYHRCILNEILWGRLSKNL